MAEFILQPETSPNSFYFDNHNFMEEAQQTELRPQ